MSKNKPSLSSLCVKSPKDNVSTQPHQLPLYATSSFTFDSVEESIDIFTGEKKGHVYSRYGNPTIDSVAAKIAALEAYGTGLPAFAFLTSSGMSAISTVMLALLKAGESILTQEDLYGGTTELFLKVLGNSNIPTHMTDLTDLNKLEDALRNNRSIKMLYMETPANPTMKCIDIKAVTMIAKKFGVMICVDNTFCTPLIQQPLLYGVDFVIHSTTKYLNGHGNSIAGIIIGHDDKFRSKIFTTLKLLGTNCNPWDAWLLNNGIKTLAIRMERHSHNATEVARFLSSHPAVNHVNYNGLETHPYHLIAKKQMRSFGGMLSFEVKGGLEAALTTINKLEFCTLAPTLGDVDTLVLHPTSSSHLNVDKATREANGITDGLIRLSVGIEAVEDIIADLDQALQAQKQESK